MPYPRNAKAPAGFPWAQSVMMHIYWHAGDISVKGACGGWNAQSKPSTIGRGEYMRPHCYVETKIGGAIFTATGV